MHFGTALVVTQLSDWPPWHLVQATIGSSWCLVFDPANPSRRVEAISRANSSIRSASSRKQLRERSYISCTKCSWQIQNHSSGNIGGVDVSWLIGFLLWNCEMMVQTHGYLIRIPRPSRGCHGLMEGISYWKLWLTSSWHFQVDFVRNVWDMSFTSMLVS